MPVWVVRETERTTRERKPLRRAVLWRWALPLRRAPPTATRFRHSNSTIARIVKVTPARGGAKWKVQPPWRRSYRAGPA